MFGSDSKSQWCVFKRLSGVAASTIVLKARPLTPLVQVNGATVEQADRIMLTHFKMEGLSLGTACVIRLESIQDPINLPTVAATIAEFFCPASTLVTKFLEVPYGLPVVGRSTGADRAGSLAISLYSIAGTPVLANFSTIFANGATPLFATVSGFFQPLRKPTFDNDLGT